MTQLTSREKFQRLYYFFPFQLLILHFKKNHLLLIFWFILFGIITEYFGTKYGVPLLFLLPEYIGKSDFWAYAILGFAMGGFIMAFNLYSYIMHGFRFPFIASVSRPFFKFSVNNFIIPVLYVLTYIWLSIDFQINRELLPAHVIITNIFAYLIGITVFILISLTYFLRTNKDVFNIHGGNKQRKVQLKDSSFLNIANRWRNVKQNQRTWRVETYLTHPFKVGLARPSEHYSDDIINKVFYQNHINASIFEVIIIISFVLLGSFREFKFLLIPAGACFLLLLTMLLMIISALYSWFKGWTTTIFVVIIFMINIASSRDNFLGIQNKAYGINYEKDAINYMAYLQSGMPTAEQINYDKEYVLEILNNWKLKNQLKYGEEKPRIVFLNCSGGGLRSGLWTLRSMSYLDSVTNGSFFDHTFLITGSSGGMLGIAYYRELALQAEKQRSRLNGMQYFDSLGRDILNPIAVSLATNDLFIRYQSFEYNGTRYVKDRAYAFEKQLDENTGYVLDKNLADYKKDEHDAHVPMLILSPTIANDGRKMLISATPVSYLTRTQIPGISSKSLAENISMEHMLQNHNPEQLKFTTALRMSSTFPYILPAVTLPTQPKLDIMDAGMRDNFGFTTTAPFISVFYDWIRENTSGIVIVQLRDLEKKARFAQDINTSFSARLVGPLGSVYSNIFNTHNYLQDEILAQMTKWVDIPFDVVSLELVQEEKTVISLSWHLTEYERLQIRRGMQLPNNQKAVKKIVEMIDRPKTDSIP